MNNKKKRTIIVICIACIVGAVLILIYPSIYSYQCKTRTFEDLSQKVTDTVLSSNIVIVKCEEKAESENVTRKSYSVGASGAVFKSEGNIYYALTAYHVVKDFERSEYIIIPYGEPSYSEYRRERGSFVSNEEYYGQFGKAKVLFSDEKSDLAIILFESKRALNVLNLSERNPKEKDRIAAIGNPEGEQFICTFGYIRSTEDYLFDSKDELPPVPTIKHNAYIANGNSGGMVLNEDMELVGINIGGGTDMFHRFKYAVMVPSKEILEFLRKNGF